MARTRAGVGMTMLVLVALVALVPSETLAKGAKKKRRRVKKQEVQLPKVTDPDLVEEIVHEMMMQEHPPPQRE
jgi:hypothetical protein